MKTQTTIKRTILTLACALAMGVPAAHAGKGASYASLTHAINSGSVDAIVAEIERAEKLPCSACIDLVEPLIDDERPQVRDVAAWWLAKRAVRARVRDDMFTRLESGDTISARNAAEVLGRFAHPDALLPLETAIHDGGLGEEARAAAATAIGSIGVPEGKAILEGAATSESPAVRAAAAKALRNIRGNTEGAAIVTLLRDSHDQVVQQAALTLGAVREPVAVPDLMDVVSDPSGYEVSTRKAAAWALGKIGDRSAADLLAAVAEDDPDMLVRGAARVALRDL